MAVADIVDNSISAGAKKIDIWFHWNGPESWLTIADDGRGMNDTELVEAMRPGSQHPLDTRSPTDFGRFGLGLKTASFSQCRRLTLSIAKSGEIILEKVMIEAPQLLENMPDDVVIPPETYSALQEPSIDLTDDLICRAVAYDKSKKVLRIDGYLVLKNIAQGKTTLNGGNKDKVRKLTGVLIGKGFDLNSTN